MKFLLAEGQYQFLILLYTIFIFNHLKTWNDII